jgi:hypothetical protein
MAMGIVAMACLSAMPASAQQVEPMRVGIIDTQVTQVGGSGDVTVEAASFLAPGLTPGSHRTETGREHGSMVASSFVEQARAIDADRPIRIYSAIAFSSIDKPRDDAGNRPMAVHYPAAVKALEWFSQNKVKVVVAAFYGGDTPAMNDFMQAAKRLGMVVYAGTNNVKSPTLPFPARHPDAISVTGNGAAQDFRFNRSMDGWVMFKANSAMPGSSPKKMVLESGSSYAVGRAAAFGSYAVAIDGALGRDHIVEAMRIAGGTGEKDRVVDLSNKDVAVRFQNTLMKPVTQMAKGPDTPEVGMQMAMLDRSQSR